MIFARFLQLFYISSLFLICGTNSNDNTNLSLDKSVKFTPEDRKIINGLEQRLEYIKLLVENLACQHHTSTQCFKYLVFNYVDDEKLAETWLDIHNTTMVFTNYDDQSTQLRYSTNITTYNMELAQAASVFVEQIYREFDIQARLFQTTSFSPENQRKLHLLLRLQFTNDAKVQKDLTATLMEAENIFSTSTVCVDSTPDESTPACHLLTPGLINIMANSRNEGELRSVWVGWRNAVSPKVKELYPSIVELTNVYATTSGYKNQVEAELDNYEMKDFDKYVVELWEEMRPLYVQLHAYVRRKLKDFYGNDVIPGKTIPAHLLGNMWAQEWGNVYDLVEPFPGQDSTDITHEMKMQNYTVNHIYKIVENFFLSIGLEPMPESFWDNSLLERPEDPNRDVDCFGQSTDLSMYKDVRIIMCTEVTEKYLQNTHHEMGHIEYFLLYRKQPMVFRGGANEGFHEAIGDTMSLSSSTHGYLYQLGLLKSPTITFEQRINRLMKSALDVVAFLPFSMVIDLWRWGCFKGTISPQEFNKKWWELRYKYQGIHPPVKRSIDDFDPASVYHINMNIPYIRYFVSHILQFQFHRALCKEAESKVPVDECSIYQSKKAGAKLREMLEMGMSRTWQEALQVLTGDNMMDTRAIKDYYKPLLDWLVVQNEGEVVGWDEEGWKSYFEGENF